MKEKQKKCLLRNGHFFIEQINSVEDIVNYLITYSILLLLGFISLGCETLVRCVSVLKITL